jgi:3-ketosteroid 9alpha-monooxygenase subunit A
MVERFEIEVDTTRANEFWNAEVADNLKAQEVSGEVSGDVPAERH